MKAAVRSRYGPPEVVEVKDVAAPAPEADEILVRVRATTVAAADWRFRKADPVFIRFMTGLARPKTLNILGMEFAGEVERVGDRVTRFALGERVFGSMGTRFGAHAEYACLPETGLVARQPRNATDEEAAGILFGGVSALHFLRKANIQPGQRVLVYGASGCVGTFAVQLARCFGAAVTGVCGPASLDLVRSLGAETVVDYTREDFSKAGRIYDVVFDTVGKSGFWRSVRSIRRGGVYLLAADLVQSARIAGWLAAASAGVKVIGGMARAQAGDPDFLRDLVEAGQLKPVIGRRYRFDEIAEAHRYAEGGHKQGNVVVVGP